MRLFASLQKRFSFITVVLGLFSPTVALAVDVNVQDLSAQSLTCKTNRITWKRPSAASIPCGSIARYRVYRNGLLVSDLGPPQLAATFDVSCADVTYTAAGDSGAGVNLVDEQSTHSYKVKVLDTNGVEHTTSIASSVTSPACAPDPYHLSINMTLVTFADVVDAGCASYPCVVTAPPGAPFTLLKAHKDMFLTSGENDRPPLAWVLQQNAPNKTISVTGEVKGWVVLPERSHYCPSPYELAQCNSAHNQMVSDAIAARGAMAIPRIDGFFLYGTNSGGYATTSPVASAGEVRFASKVATGLPSVNRLEHEGGHLGLFDSVSSRMIAHSFSLRCPNGIAVGPDLRDLSKGPTGTPSECVTVDYGDDYCTMGNEYVLFNAYSRWRQGLIDVSNVYTVPGPELDSTVLLEHLNAPSSLNSSHIKMIRVALDRNVADTSYTLEYRGGSAWRELDYRQYCPKGQCTGSSVPQGSLLPQGVYLKIKVRNPVDLGASKWGSPGSPFSPNGSVQILALEKEIQPGVFKNLYLDMANPVYCDPYRDLKITLLEFTTNGGVDTAKVRITKQARCNAP